ncbi:dephospho-CoA kinase [Maribacter algicola]|uniref:Dephospho-CoA kinase n=1 Tax=Meishania litoralis TaxID=3434685 RepID=A0ACC7LME1_9FLAO
MIVGLTGGIGSGKSTVAEQFEALGIPVYESDRMAKKLMKSSKKLRRAIIEIIGQKAYDDKKLNTAYIAQKVFNDPELLAKLNAIVHPAVRRHFLKWREKQHSPYVIQENAIIFETGSQDFYDKIVLVTAPLDLRISRVLSRDNISKEDLLARINNQLNDSEKISLADYVIENIDLNKTKDKTEEIHRLLLEYI